MQQISKQIVGSFETISFPDFNGYEVMAKIETGAYTGALHCTKIQEETAGQQGLLKTFLNNGIQLRHTKHLFYLLFDHS